MAAGGAAGLAGRQLARADLVTGAVLALAAIWIIAEALAMPRFEARGINPWTVPGIMPGMIGVVLLVLGSTLVGRALGRLRRSGQSDHALPGDAPDGDALLVDAADPLAATEPGRSRPTGTAAVLLAALIGGGYVLLLGILPFAPLTFAFLLLFMGAFEWRQLVAGGDRTRRLGLIALTAALVAMVVPVVFERLFLVRLP